MISMSQLVPPRTAYSAHHSDSIAGNRIAPRLEVSDAATGRLLLEASDFDLQISRGWQIKAWLFHANILSQELLLRHTKFGPDRLHHGSRKRIQSELQLS